jgi:hypothetical protein
MAAISTPAVTRAAARPKNRLRQPSAGNSSCTGSVDATMPSDPDINIHEFRRSCSGRSNSRKKAASGAIRLAETPMPISRRASTSSPKLRASANPTQPSTAATSSANSTWRAP